MLYGRAPLLSTEVRHLLSQESGLWKDPEIIQAYRNDQFNKLKEMLESRNEKYIKHIEQKNKHRADPNDVEEGDLVLYKVRLGSKLGVLIFLILF